MPDIAVVILNWNGKSYLERFLPVLIERTPGAEIIVADNASADDSVQFLKTSFPQIRIIQNDKNYGFAEGYNISLSQIDARYFVLLNSDIEVDHNWLEPLVSVMESDSEIAACQPKIIDYYKRNLFEYAGASGGFIDKLGFPFCRGRIFNSIEEDHGQYDEMTDVFWASGACLMVRADCFKTLGGLDADFFAHMEEIDFCWRLHNHGKKVVVVPESKVFHIGGGTLPKKSSHKTYLNFRNNYLLLFKNLKKHKVFTVLTIRLFLDWFAACKFLSEGNFGDFVAVFKAQLHTYFSFRKHSLKRRKNPSFSEKFMFDRSIVFEHYVRKIKKFSELKPRQFRK